MDLAGQPELSPRAWAGTENGFSLGAPSLRVAVSASSSTALGLETPKSLLQQGWGLVLGWERSAFNFFPVEQSLGGIPAGPHREWGRGCSQPQWSGGFTRTALLWLGFG